MLTFTRKENYSQEVGDSKDRLSNLPDDILTHILSSLPTKEVVRTSILSTRWKSLWASVQTLDLKVIPDDFLSDNDRNGGVLNFLDKILTGHSMPFLKKFAIRFKWHNSSILESCICAARERNVSHLLLELEWKTCDFPRSLLSCNSLVVLKLCSDLVLDFPPTSMCFPNLKVLELVKVRYKDNDSAQNLFSSCPLLEDLVVTYSSWDDNRRIFNVTSRSLKYLSLNLSYLHKLVIDAPALEVVDIKNGFTLNNEMRDLSSLIKAKVYFQMCYLYDKRLFDQQLRMISNVKILLLTSTCMNIKPLSHRNCSNLLRFHNLTHMELCENFIGDKFDWKFLLEFLNKLPVLKVLILGAFSFSPDEEVEASQRKVPSCLLSHLKTIKILKFIWRWRETKKLRYFLENSNVLEKMIVRFLYQKEEHEYVQDLLVYWRASKACQIEILPSLV